MCERINNPIKNITDKTFELSSEQLIAKFNTLASALKAEPRTKVSETVCDLCFPSYARFPRTWKQIPKNYEIDTKHYFDS